MTFFRLGLMMTCWLVAAQGMVPKVASSAETLQDMLPGVVRIIAKTKGGGERHGSGFIIQKKPDELAILTAAHVVAGNKYPMVEFFTARGQKVKAEVQEGSELDDRVRGLALLIVREMKHVPQDVNVLSLSREAVQVSSGESMAVLGLPRGAGDWAVIHGHMVSRRGRDLKFDARIDEGVSGGPIIRDGQVMGLVQIIETYGQGNPADSIWVFLQGFGIRPISGGVVGGDDPGGFKAYARKKEQESQQILPKTKTGERVVQQKTREPLEPPAKLPNSPLPQTITGKDWAPMVLVPAGEFTKGSSNFEDNPPRKQFVKAFYIDKYEVTVERYAKFLSQASDTDRIPAGWDDVDFVAHRNHPVAGTNYFDANFYCLWAGKRLPTNAEWEKAARGTDNRLYPWGNQTPNETMANFNKNYCFFCNVYDEKISPVGTFKNDKSPYGIFDMAGNVTEWVEEGNRRGGDWRTGWPGAAESMELARLWPSAKGTKNPGGNPDQGFRCAAHAS